jgi:hypothetical protein
MLMTGQNWINVVIYLFLQLTLQLEKKLVHLFIVNMYLML